MDSYLLALLDALRAAYPDYSVSYEGLNNKSDHRFDFRDKEGLPSAILTVSFDALTEAHYGEIVAYLKFSETEKAWKAKGVNDALSLTYNAADGLEHS